MGVPGKGGVYFLELLDQSQSDYIRMNVFEYVHRQFTMITRTTFLLESLTVHIPETC